MNNKPAFATRWPEFDEVTGKPSTYPPSSHTHAVSDITGLDYPVDSVNSKTGTVVLTALDVGAAPEADVETLQQEMLVVQEEVSTAQGDIDDHKAAENPHGIVVPPPGRVNLLLNGDFRIWQRGEYFEDITTYDAYTSDRWTSFADEGSFSVGKPTEGGFNFVTSESASASALGQYIENPVFLRGGSSLTLSFDIEWITLPSLCNFRIFWTKEDNSTEGTVAETEVALEDGKQVLSIDLEAAPDEDHKNIKCDFYCQGGVNYVINNIQLSEGPTEYPFERTHIAEELALCERYFHKMSAKLQYSPLTIPVGQYYQQRYSFPTSMRISPTITFEDGGGGGGVIDFHSYNKTGVIFRKESNYAGGDNTLLISALEADAEI